MEYNCGLPCLLLLVVCALTAEGRYVHGAGHLSDVLDLSIEIERPCFTKSKSLVSCSGVGADRLMPHPDDCHLFYQCTHMWPICHECPADLHFNPIKHVCDRPENAGCANSSINIEPTILPSVTTSWPTNTTSNFSTEPQFTTPWPINTRPDFNKTTELTNTTSNSTEPHFTTPWPINTTPDFNITTGPNNTRSNSTEPQFTTPSPINTRPDFNITTELTNTTFNVTEPQFTTPWPINTRPEFNKTAIPTSTTFWTTTPWWTPLRLSSTTRDSMTTFVTLH